MLYKPKFCCECGVPIERTEWTFLASRRFCQLCDTDYKFVDWIPRVTMLAGILLGIFGLGTFLQKPAKPLNLVSSNAANVSKSVVNAPVSAVANAASTSKTQEVNSAAAQSSPKSPVEVARQDVKVQKLENQQNAAQEVIYFCGAETQKGTPCTRRKKGGGRCWQHAGKAPMLPPDKLIASR